MKKGLEYRYTLYTHCGLDALVDFNGSLWDFAGPGSWSDGHRNPPPGFDNPEDHGTMKLISPEVAQYRSSQDSVVQYKRREKPKQMEMCL